jgi:hypothetical protein
MINYSNVYRTAHRELSKDIYTSIPGHVLAFDPTLQRAQIQIGIVRVDINGAEFNPPPIVDVLVQFPGDGFCMEFQIDPNCEGMVHFSQRCIDAWKSTGGIANNPIGRFHDMQDAMFVPGVRSQGNVIQGFSNNGMKLRNKAGTQYAWLKNDGSIDLNNGNGHVTIGVDGIVNINGVTFDTLGNVKGPGEIKSPTVEGTTSLKVAGKEVGPHTHDGVQPGTGTSGGMS